MALTPRQQNAIAALEKAGAMGACNRCGHNDFGIMDGYVYLAS
jgi:hypothetical protein